MAYSYDKLVLLPLKWILGGEEFLKNWGYKSWKSGKSEFTNIMFLG